MAHHLVPWLESLSGLSERTGTELRVCIFRGIYLEISFGRFLFLWDFQTGRSGFLIHPELECSEGKDPGYGSGLIFIAPGR
jgi:hypothetical protein